MAPPDFYRPCPPELCQGDVFTDMPSLALRELPLRILRKETGRGGATIYKPFDWPPPDNPPLLPPNGIKLGTGAGDEVIAKCNSGFGMLLTHGCDLDNDVRTRVMAIIRPIGPIPEEARAAVRENRNFGQFYLPAIGNMPESYVDLRRLTSVDPALMAPEKRLVSLTEVAVRALHVQLMRNLIRLEPDFETLRAAQEEA